MIDVVIVNWNAGGQLAALLDSLSRSDLSALGTVVVVDNASDDDSITRARAATDSADLRVEFVHNRENRGFGAACNQGASLGTSEFVLFLNPDCVVGYDSISGPAQAMRGPEFSDVAVVGIQLRDEEGTIWRSCARRPTTAAFLAEAVGLVRWSPLRGLGYRMEEWAHDEDRDVGHVIGAFYLIRRDVFEALRGFDERFFVYLEDLDLSVRVADANHRIRFLAEFRATHLGGGTSRKIVARRLYYSLRSRIAYARKHFRWPARPLLVMTFRFLDPAVRTMHALLRGRPGDVRYIREAHRLLRADLRSERVS